MNPLTGVLCPVRSEQGRPIQCNSLIQNVKVYHISVEIREQAHSAKENQRQLSHISSILLRTDTSQKKAWWRNSSWSMLDQLWPDAAFLSSLPGVVTAL